MFQSTMLADLYKAHIGEGATVENATTPTDDVAPYKGSVVERDRRLAMFGWTTETVSMLVMPMVLEKYVISYPLSLIICVV